jgi:hypothetical protein
MPWKQQKCTFFSSSVKLLKQFGKTTKKTILRESQENTTGEEPRNISRLLIRTSDENCGIKISAILSCFSNSWLWQNGIVVFLAALADLRMVDWLFLKAWRRRNIDVKFVGRKIL